MKKYLVMLLILAFVVSMLFTGIGCKGETASAEEVVEEKEEVVTTEEKEEMEEETMEEPVEVITLRWADITGSPHIDIVKEYFIPLYEEQNPGIKIEVENLGTSDLIEKTMREGVAGTGYYQFGYVSPSWQGEMMAANLLVDLTPYIEKYNFDITQYPEQTWNGMALAYGNPDFIAGLPFMAVTNFMVYRKDWFENPDEQAAFKTEYGRDLLPITSWQDMYDKAVFFTRSAGDTLAGEVLEEDIYGSGFSLGGAEVIPAIAFILMVLSTDLDIFDTETYVPDVDDPILLEVIDLWVKFIEDTMPEEAFLWDDQATSSDVFAKKGNIAMTQANSQAKFEAEDSMVSGKTGYAQWPVFEGNIKGSDIGRGFLGGGSFSIFDEAKADESFLFMQWLMETMEDEWVEKTTMFTRKNHFTNEEALKLPGMNDFLPAYLTTFENAYVRPAIPEFTPVCFIPIAPMILDVYNGLLTPEEAHQKYYDDMVQAFKDAGYLEADWEK